MNHLGTKRIETERLTLRPFALADAPAMYEHWASDPAVTKFLSWPTHQSVEVSEAVLADWVPRYDQPNYYQWAIVLHELSDTPVGSIAAVHQDERVGMMEIGYCIGKAWWGRGITAEALEVVIGFLIGEVGANRIQARHDTRNPGSGRVMEKCGMAREGVHRAAGVNNQGLCDIAMYAVLARDVKKSE